MAVAIVETRKWILYHVSNWYKLDSTTRNTRVDNLGWNAAYSIQDCGFRRTSFWPLATRPIENWREFLLAMCTVIIELIDGWWGSFCLSRILWLNAAAPRTGLCPAAELEYIPCQWSEAGKTGRYRVCTLVSQCATLKQRTLYHNKA